ncbi:S9 family peptidase [Sphingomonas abietis]|uniref:Prolyl oligopeptidase family serine peptidase n=1 Tax=Sphingomonas abietis TaxID=3012344 RepID=A0ABY7NQN4_9SPHN|nr:prolyl oligopeptidase family serine peptidase [Sphingomonas abietis]WBO22933.1 prolyl oligopeptidase family serine peptidase [Sphingomonas abietis]
MHRLMICLGAAVLPAMMPSMAAAQDGPAVDGGLSRALAMPFASGLTGAAAVPRFAWVENSAGARNVWVADSGARARAITAFTADDGAGIYDLALSRDGRMLAYVRGGDEEFPDGDIPNPALGASPPSQTVYLARLDGRAAPVPLGAGHMPVFSPRGDHIAFVRAGDLWIGGMDGQPASRRLSVSGTIEALSWSPDGTRLLFSNDRGDHRIIGLFDVDSGTLRYPDAGFQQDQDPVFSPDGKHIAFLRITDPPAGAAASMASFWSIRRVDLETGQARTVWAAPTGAGAHYGGTGGRNLLWSADDRLIFPWERDGWRHLYALPSAGGTPVALTPPGPWEVEAFQLDDAGRTLIYTGNDGDIDRRHLWRLAVGGGAATRVTGGDGAESAPIFAGRQMAVIATDATRPAHPALVADTGRMTPLADREADFAPAAGYVAPEPVILHADDGLVVHAQLFRAQGHGATHPALVFIHGGPRRQMLPGFNPMGYYANAYIMNQHFAAEGYDVLSVNYRGGTGYGHDFREAPGTGREGASEYRDVRAAGLYLAHRPDVDPKRVGLWGGSWGGYLTALGLARDSDLFAAGVDMHGVHNLLRAPPGTLSPDAQAKAQQLMWDSSPFGALATWRSPVLLVHGDDDHNVPFSQSVDLAAELTARAIPFQELVLPNERHAFLRHESWVRAYRASDAFLAERLKP